MFLRRHDSRSGEQRRVCSKPTEWFTLVRFIKTLYHFDSLAFPADQPIVEYANAQGLKVKSKVKDSHCDSHSWNVDDAVLVITLSGYRVQYCVNV